MRLKSHKKDKMFLKPEGERYLVMAHQWSCLSPCPGAGGGHLVGTSLWPSALSEKGWPKEEAGSLVNNFYVKFSLAK